MGSRTTGNDAACEMITGPNWRGEKSEGIAKVFQSETDFSFAIIRTQLFNPADIDNVKAIQAGYRGMTLSQFQNKPAPAPAPGIAWPKIDKAMADANPFAYLNFVLSLSPPTGPAAVEIPLRARFAKIGVEAGKPFNIDKLTPEQRMEIGAGVKSGLQKIKETVGQLGVEENGWRVATYGFGDRQAYGGDYALRAAAAMAGIYGTTLSKLCIRSLQPTAMARSQTQASTATLSMFPAGQLPAANAF